MKKTKVLISLILGAMMVLLPLNYSKATEYLFDENDVISFPMFTFSDLSGDFTPSLSIKDETGYTLYYQTIEISSDKYEEVQTLYDETNTLKKSCKTAATLLETAKTKYEEAISAENPNTTTQESRKKEYDERQEEYDEAEKAYNEKLDELKTATSYDKISWEKATDDDEFTIKSSEYTGTKYWAVWVKLVTSSGDTIYDMEIYTVNGSKSSNDGNSTGNNVSNNTTTTDNTVSTKKLSQTGEKSIIFIAAGLVTLTVVLYKKFNNIKLK